MAFRVEHRSRAVGLRFRVVLLLGFVAANVAAQQTNSNTHPPTFYKDVLPILQQHCQSCHRPGEIASEPFETYAQVKPMAEKIRDAAQSRKMPPWFADPCCGHFANDPSLNPTELQVLTAWANSAAPEGDRKDAPPPPKWTQGWNIPSPDSVISMPKPVSIPASGDVEYTYEIVPTNFPEGRWVQMSEVRPASRDHVHHAVIYIRPPDSEWLKGAPVGLPFTASSLKDEKLRHDAHATTSDMLLVYAPGSSPDEWADGMAKFVPAHSDLVFQMHYTTNGHAADDQTSVGIVFARKPPAHRVITLQLANDHDQIAIPPRAENYRVEVHGTLPNEALLLSFFPHLHLRGKRFEYNLVHADGTKETLLRVNYDFYWQRSYKLETPRLLEAGTYLEAVAWYDNSRHNPHNPDPDSAVHWGDQTYNEMMVGFFDVAVPARMDKWQFFIRHPAHEHR